MDTIYRMLNTSEGCFYLVQMLFALAPWGVSVVRLCKHYSFVRMFFFTALSGWCMFWIFQMALLYWQTPPGMPNPWYLLLTIAINLFFLTGIQFIIKDTQNSDSILRKVLKGGLAITISAGILGLGICVLFFQALYGTTYLCKTGDKAWLSEDEIHEIMASDSLPPFTYIPELSCAGGNHEIYQQRHTAILKKSGKESMWDYVEKLSKRKQSRWQRASWNDNIMEYKTFHDIDGRPCSLEVAVQHNDTIFITISD